MKRVIDISEDAYELLLEKGTCGKFANLGEIVANSTPLEQEPTTKNDLSLIHTEGLDEEIRCTMCTNYMKSDRGCDGSCVVNKDMYKAVMDAIEKRIQPTTKNNLGVDCISRAEAMRKYQKIREIAFPLQFCSTDKLEHEAIMKICEVMEDDRN